jgi:hypothetical protein
MKKLIFIIITLVNMNAVAQTLTSVKQSYWVGDEGEPAELQGVKLRDITFDLFLGEGDSVIVRTNQRTEHQEYLWIEKISDIESSKYAHARQYTTTTDEGLYVIFSIFGETKNISDMKKVLIFFVDKKKQITIEHVLQYSLI